MSGLVEFGRAIAASLQLIACKILDRFKKFLGRERSRRPILLCQQEGAEQSQNEEYGGRLTQQPERMTVP